MNHSNTPTQSLKMGHDIYCKNCPRPIKSECINCNCIHDSIEEDYISFDHSVNSDIWHVSMAHGHAGRVVSNQLERAIKQMTDDVFLVHLLRIKAMTDRNPELTFLFDPYWSTKYDTNDYAYDKTPDTIIKGPVKYYRHPIKGIMNVDNFVTASDVVALMRISCGSRSSAWIAISNQMSKSSNR